MKVERIQPHCACPREICELLLFAKLRIRKEFVCNWSTNHSSLFSFYELIINLILYNPTDALIQMIVFSYKYEKVERPNGMLYSPRHTTY